MAVQQGKVQLPTVNVLELHVMLLFPFPYLSLTQISECRREIKKKESVFSLKYFNPQPTEIQVDQHRLLENMRIAFTVHFLNFWPQ